MYEYEIRNLKTNEERILFGYTLENAMRKAGIETTNEWKLVYAEYID